MPKEVAETVFSSGTLQIDFFAAPVRSDKLLCSFTTFNHRSLAGRGFAGKFAADNGFDLVAVKNTTNDFYQHVATDAVQAVETFLTSLGRRWRVRATYGSSMGAYAAIHFAPAFRATHVLALSPRYDLTQTRANWWRLAMCSVDEVRRLRPEGVRAGCVYVLVYDPTNLDQADVDSYARVIPGDQLRVVAVPYAGHPVGDFLVAAGILKPLAVAALTGSELPDIRAGSRATRADNPAYFANLAAHCFRRGKLGWAGRCAERASQLEPAEWNHALRAAQIAEAGHRLPDATTHALAALRLAPDQPQVLLSVARLAFKAGMLEHAADYAAQGLRSAPGNPPLVELARRIAQRRTALDGRGQDTPAPNTPAGAAADAG